MHEKIQPRPHCENSSVLSSVRGDEGTSDEKAPIGCQPVGFGLRLCGICSGDGVATPVV